MENNPILESFSRIQAPSFEDPTHLGTWEEITQAIAERRAVAFVGAGVSATTDLKTWNGLLSAQYEAAKVAFSNTDDIRKVTEVLAAGDLTLGAALLKRLRGTQFTRDLAAAFGEYRLPGAAHLALARLPFSQVVTTNYDPLLELAYDPPITDTINYDQSDSMLERVRQDEFALIKLHGHMSNMHGAILTDDDFRSIQRIRPLVQCLRILFLIKHVVFIGHSLRDPDLLGLLSDLKQQFPHSGPHYAILDDDISKDLKGERQTKNAAQSFLDYLKYSLNIHGVVYQYDGSNRTEELIRHLTLLHGGVSKHKAAGRPVGAENPDEGLERRLASLLKGACTITGSFRGDLAFFDDRKYAGWAITQSRLRMERLHALDEGCKDSGMPKKELETYRKIECTRICAETAVPDTGLYIEYCYGPTDGDITHEPNVGRGVRRLEKPVLSYPQSVIWTAYNWSRGPKMLNDAKEPNEKKVEDIENYRASDTRVISELAVPIHVGDARVGVLNLESNIKAAYTERHKEVATELTREIGLVWDRIVRAEIYRDVTLDPNAMRKERPSDAISMKMSSAAAGKSELATVIGELVPFNIGFSLFIADHGRGRLVRRFGSELEGRHASVGAFPHYSFEARSFAGMIFRKRRPLYLPDWRETRGWVQVNEEMALRSRIDKELVGVPLFSRGLRIGVLTAWPKHRDKSSSLIGADGAELIIRTAQLFARTDYLRQITQFQYQHDTTHKQCMRFRELVSSISRADLRRAGQAHTANPKVVELLACIREMVGICSIRLFWAKKPFSLATAPPGRIALKCIGSIWGKRSGNNDDRNAPIAPRFMERSHHLKNKPNSTDNPYVEYLVRRSMWSASAMLLYPGLLNTFGAPHAAKASIRPGPVEDPVATSFDRDPRVGWYVAPITRCETLTPAQNELEWIEERRNFLGFLAVDNTVELHSRMPEVNELPASRTWHELARLKLTWCAATIGRHITRAHT